MGKPKPSHCKDCGSPDIGWSSHWKSNPGPAACRCRDCYLAYTRIKQTERSHGRKYAPGVMADRRLGPPRPTGPKPCAQCGEMFVKSNASLTCPTCARLNRDDSENRRRAAYRDGDASIHWRPLGERDGWRCHLCGDRVPRRAGTAHEPLGATVDHLIPIADGGEHEWENVALAHRHCNISRGTGVAQLRLVG